MQGLQNLVALLGRLMLAAIFLGSAWNKIQNTDGTIAYMTQNGVPEPDILIYGAIAFLILGGLSLVVGFQARIGALLLLIFLGMTTYYFHWFFDMPSTTEAEQQALQAQQIQFMKNAAIFGGLLMVLAFGPGAMSLDGRKAGGKGDKKPGDKSKKPAA